MTNKQSFIIGFCVIIGLVLHAYMTRIGYQLGNLNNQSLKINTKTGEVAVFGKESSAASLTNNPNYGYHPLD